MKEGQKKKKRKKKRNLRRKKDLNTKFSNRRETTQIDCPGH
jgi:hypothetical protein